MMQLIRPGEHGVDFLNPKPCYAIQITSDRKSAWEYIEVLGSPEKAQVKWKKTYFRLSASYFVCNSLFIIEMLLWTVRRKYEEWYGTVGHGASLQNMIDFIILYRLCFKDRKGISDLCRDSDSSESEKCSVRSLTSSQSLLQFRTIANYGSGGHRILCVYGFNVPLFFT
eukprot:TRINITY_DN1213_c0_g1_i1.p1 TRINITY_DN1213_c0_g1~~TRINITY_DN1213_c0_g1_i1.p1  ORF type:complete len:169 (-),score=1.52 TRINITY_DN1213_c0_g1_i1:119-625(-)